MLTPTEGPQQDPARVVSVVGVWNPVEANRELVPALDCGLFEALGKALSSVIARLHVSRFRHRDLKPENVFYRFVNASALGVECAIPDWDHGRGASLKELQADLERGYTQSAEPWRKGAVCLRAFHQELVRDSRFSDDGSSGTAATGKAAPAVASGSAEQSSSSGAVVLTFFRGCVRWSIVVAWRLSWEKTRQCPPKNYAVAILQISIDPRGQASRVCSPGSGLPTTKPRLVSQSQTSEVRSLRTAPKNSRCRRTKGGKAEPRTSSLLCPCRSSRWLLRP